MLKNINSYKFMHKQIIILIGLFLGASTSYLIVGYKYGSMFIELVWCALLCAVSLWGYKLYKTYSDSEYSIKEKEIWLKKVRYFLFSYFFVWTIIFIVYVSKENIELHYIALTTQLGVAVIATIILVSEKKLALIILVSSMLPITIYMILIGEFYGYVIATLSVVLAGVLLYGSRNTYTYIQRTHFQAYHDYLTNLGNRRYFIERLEDSIKIQKKDGSYMFLLLIDLDHFKTINDTLGHDIGDLLLKKVANRMSEKASIGSCSVFRLGGDEFCVLSSSYSTKEECLKKAEYFANELLELIKKTYIINEHHLYISASIGVSIIDSPKMSANVFIKEADIAMYEAKSNGRDGVILFNEEFSIRIERKLAIERLLHFAIEHDEIKLKYQPQSDLEGKVVGCEVLARWNNSELGSVSPEEFIPISEDTGVIVELGHFILEEAFKTFKEWSDNGILLEQYSINISMRQFQHNSFVEEVQSLCEEYLSDEIRSKLMFEMTETSIAGDIDSLVIKMEQLKACGIEFSMDDFGTGYSSLSYLRKIPISELKIDKSFILELEEESNDKSIVRTILDIARNLNLNVVAEGVETSSQRDFLIGEKCDILQGYYYSRPIDKHEFSKYVRSNS